MSELVIVVIVLFAVSVVVYVIVSLYNKRATTMASTHLWEIREHSVPQFDAQRGIAAGVAVSIERKGEQPIHIGTVRCDAPDFEELLTDLRVRAEDRLAILNRGLPAPS